MKADKANNDFSAWDSSIWAVVDGYPQFASQVSSNIDCIIPGVTIDGGNVALENGKTYDLSATVSGIETTNNPVVSVMSGKEVVTVNGTSITATALGNAVIKVVYGKNIMTINVEVVPPTYVFEEELQFSAYDGLFFNGEDVVDVNLIVDGKEVLSVTDAEGNALELVDGKLVGITSTTEDWVENTITFETEDAFYQVNVKVATLIIDEAEDFTYFTIKQPWDYSVTYQYAYEFTQGDFDWEGYYVLAKNIDATGYVHDLDQGLGVTTGSTAGTTKAYTHMASITANRIDYLSHDGIQYHSTRVPYDHGFNGKLDGQGYTISNLTTDANGLLGVATGAVIQNLGIVNCNASNGYAPLGYAICGSTKLYNVFVSTPTKFATSSHAPLFADWSSTIYSCDNVVIYDNTIIPDGSYGWSFGYGSLTINANRDAANQATGFGPSNSWMPGQSNMIIVSSVPMSVSCAGKQVYKEGTVMMDAAYIDGVKNENVYLIKVGSTSGVEVAPIAGVRRYTSQETLTADASKITSQLNKLINSGYFKVENGVITWKNAPVA